MTKNYKFNYADGNYTLTYSNPAEKRDAFCVNEETMQFDTKYFYEYVFKDVNEKIIIQIDNVMDENAMDKNTYKRGLRVYSTIDELCKQIVDGINTKCFGVVNSGE